MVFWHRLPGARITLAAALLLYASAVLAQVPTLSSVETYLPGFFAGARPNTAMDMIARLPGFSLDGGDATRGLSGNAGNVLIDGQRPASKSDSLSTYLSRIPASDVDRIEVIHGGAAGFDMQGRAVVANVVRKKIDSSTLVLEAQETLLADGSALPGGRAEFTRRVGDQTYEASIQRDASFNFYTIANRLDVLDTASGIVTRTPIDRSATGGKLVLRGAVKSPLVGGDFDANLTLQQDYFNNRSLYFHIGPAAQLFHTNSQNRSGEFGANYERNIGAATLDVVLLQKLGESRNLSTAVMPGDNSRYVSKNDTGESISRFSLQFPFSQAVTIESGGEVAYNFLSGKVAFSENGAAVVLPSSTVLVEEIRGEGFAQLIWKIDPKWTLETGVRAEFSTISQSGDVRKSRSFVYPKPRALLSWDISQNAKLRLRLERKLGQISFYDFVTSANLATAVITSGNPELQPDQRWQFEIGYEYHFWEKGALTFTLLHQDVAHVLDFKPVSGPGYIFDVFGNIGSGRIDRASVGWTLPLDTLGLQNGLLTGSYTWHDSKVQDAVTGRPRRISYDSANNFNFNLAHDLPKWDLSWSVYYNSGWKQNSFLLEEINRSFGGGDLGLSLSYKPQPDVTLYFQADHLFGVHSEERRYIYGGPRNTAGVSSIRTEINQDKPQFLFSLRKTFN